MFPPKNWSRDNEKIRCFGNTKSLGIILEPFSFLNTRIHENNHTDLRLVYYGEKVRWELGKNVSCYFE